MTARSLTLAPGTRSLAVAVAVAAVFSAGTASAATYYWLDGAHILPGTLALNRLTPAAINYLHHPGPPGPAGSARGWITVNPSGTIVAHGGVLAEPQVSVLSTGTYCVTGTGWGSGAFTVSTLALGSVVEGANVNPGLLSDNCTQLGHGTTVYTVNGSGNPTSLWFTLAKIN